MPSAPAELVARRAGEIDDVEPVDPFRWNEIAAATDRQWVKNQTEQIQTLAYRTTCDLVRIGQLLASVRGKVAKGTFCRWAVSEMPWSLSHTYRLIDVGASFGECISHTEKERFEPTALYMLANPSVPAHVREYAVELSRVKVIDVREARRMIDGYQSSNVIAEPTRKELRDYEREKRRDLGIDEKPSAPSIAEPTMRERAWDSLESLVNDYGTVHITRMDDTEPYPDEQVPASVTCLGGEAGPRNDIGGRLMDVILRMAGREEKKQCLRCKKMLPLSQFSLCKKSSDGRNRYCLKDERARVKEFDAKRQAKKVAEQGQVGQGQAGEHAGGESNPSD